MTGELERRYPDEPAGPFPEPPATITDAEGRVLAIEPLADDDEVRDALTHMYTQFHPADRAQGIPPSGEEAIRDWLDPLVGRGVNVAVRPIAPMDDRNVTGGEEQSESGPNPEYVGHAVLVPDTDDETITDRSAYEWELAIFVLQDYQGAGVGTELLAHLLGEATGRGIEHVWLTVERWNGAAITLYERTGFERIGAESFDMEMAITLGGETAD